MAKKGYLAPSKPAGQSRAQASKAGTITYGSSAASSGGSSSSGSKSTTTSTPSGVTTKNANAQLRAGNISQAQYNQIMGGSNSTPTQSATAVNYTFTNQTTGKSQTLTAAQLAALSPATRNALMGQISSGAITGTSGGKAINASIFSNPSTPTTTPKTTPTVVQQPNVTATGKTISQDAYDRFVAQAKLQGKSDADISSAMQKAGFTVASTQQITPNQAGDVLSNKQIITADNGKVYEVTIDKDGKASFESQGGLGTRTFNSLDEAINVIKAANPAVPGQVPEEPMVDRLQEGESDIQGITELTDFAEQQRQLNLKNFQDQMAMLQPYIDQLAQYNQQTATALDSTISQRFASMNSNFDAISQSIKDLETKANDLFDVNAMVARQTRAKQLADAGILTSEQAASAAQYSMQDYTMNVELKRSELMQQAQEAMTNALKEKSALQDQILQQQGIDAVTKQNMVQQVNTMYQNMINGYAEKVNQANAQYDSAIQNARAKQVEVDLQRKLPLIQEEAAKDLNATQKASANSDPQYRYDYVLNKFGELDANLKSFVANLMGTYKNNGTFMSQDIDTFISELAKKAQAAYKSYNTVSSGVSNPAAATPPAGTLPAGTSPSVDTRTPSTVGLNFGFQPKINYNPLMSTPMQSTVGGV